MRNIRTDISGVNAFSKAGKRAPSRQTDDFGEARQRYRGRSQSRPQPEPKPQPASRPQPQPRLVTPSPEVPQAKDVVQRAPLASSRRLIAALLAAIALLVLTRLLGEFSPPLAAPTGVEATHASFVRHLSQQMTGGGEGAALSGPWEGVAPVDPITGLPLFSFLAALLAQLVGVDLAGTALSVILGACAALCLFATMHRTGGARAAFYGILLYIVAPLSMLFGRHYSPAALILFLQAATMLLIVRWHGTVSTTRPHGSHVAAARAAVTALVYGAIDPGALFLALPTFYLCCINAQGKGAATRTPTRAALLRVVDQPAASNWGRFVLFAGSLILGTVLWQVYRTGVNNTLRVEDGGAGGLMAALVNGGTYVQIVGGLVGQIAGMLGLLLMCAGLLAGARGGYRYLYHVWMGAGLLHVLIDSGRLAVHNDVLLPLLLPACALAGLGAAWSASFPARVWHAITERRQDAAEDYAISPHTAWLLDLPEEKLTERPSRPQAQLSFGKNLAQRSRSAGVRVKRASLVLGGHAVVAGCLGMVLLGAGTYPVQASETRATSPDLMAAGLDVASVTPPDAQIVVAGRAAPELFYASRRAGWALGTAFSLSDVQALQRSGADYLLSADQESLGRHPEYVGLLTNFSVARLSRDYILFDLNTRPAASDRLYFLESGHTLGGDFRQFWETHGSIAKLGFPISEEYEDKNPIDGQTRKVQYFERAVLEYHPAGIDGPTTVMLAPVGLWVTKDRTFPRVAPFGTTEDRAYFAETGHSLKQAFFRYWLREGGLAQFGYPISEELPEISQADGKVYTVQYFERARFEWHPADAGTGKEVQLGLVGKQALEMRK